MCFSLSLKYPAGSGGLLCFDSNCQINKRRQIKAQRATDIRTSLTCDSVTHDSTFKQTRLFDVRPFSRSLRKKAGIISVGFVCLVFCNTCLRHDFHESVYLWAELAEQMYKCSLTLRVDLLHVAIALKKRYERGGACKRNSKGDTRWTNLLSCLSLKVQIQSDFLLPVEPQQRHKVFY